MKTILLLGFLVISSIAYEKGKIDTHGGQYDNLYGREKSTFPKDIACMSDFLNRDKNSTQKSKK